MAFASFVMSETALESRSCNFMLSVGSISGSSPGTNMPPMAAGPAEGLSAVLPAASPTAEIPGFGLAMRAFMVPGSGTQDAASRPIVASPRSHPAHNSSPQYGWHGNQPRRATVLGEPSESETDVPIPVRPVNRAVRPDRAAAHPGRHVTGPWPGSVGRDRSTIESHPRVVHDDSWYPGNIGKTVIYLLGCLIFRQAGGKRERATAPCAPDGGPRFDRPFERKGQVKPRVGPPYRHGVFLEPHGHLFHRRNGSLRSHVDREPVLPRPSGRRFRPSRRMPRSSDDDRPEGGVSPPARPTNCRSTGARGARPRSCASPCASIPSRNS